MRSKLESPWALALVPLLAVVAYITVVRIGFVSDDFLLLGLAKRGGLDFSVLVPAPHWYLYRPLGYMLVWELGWYLWGLNPLPYHIEALLLHAGVSLLLTLWAAVATNKRVIGLLAGALFAAFPLHLEAVGWAAGLWDVLAVFFGLFSLWLFTRWWKSRSSLLVYVLSVLLYALAIFTKESMLSFLPVFALSAWLAAPYRRGGMQWRDLIIAMLPFCAVLSLNATLRLLSWGHLGGYGTIQTDYGAMLPVFWDNLLSFAHMLLSPINSTLVGNVPAQLVGAFTSIALLVGVILFGRKIRRMLLLSMAWVLLSIAPVLNLSINVYDLESNRFYYLMSAGYCAGVAALLHETWLYARRWRPAVASGIGVLLLLSSVMCWVQLEPWHVATVQAESVETSLNRLVPVAATGSDEAWYVENLPDSYHGAFVFRLGFGGRRSLTAGKSPTVQSVANASEAPIATAQSNAFALRYQYFGDDPGYRVTFAMGITEGMPPPSPEQQGEHLILWDFRDCSGGMVNRWHIGQAHTTCSPDKGLTVQGAGDDPQMLGSLDISDPHSGSEESWVRLRVAARYPLAESPTNQISQWFWQGQAKGWSEERSRSITVRQDGIWHVYWTFVPAKEIGEGISSWRFDPVNSAVPVDIEWIAIDQVKER